MPWHSARSATSERELRKSVPSAARSRTQRASSPSSMSVTHTRAPASPNARAMPQPRPRAAPVTSATESARSRVATLAVHAPGYGEALPDRPHVLAEGGRVHDVERPRVGKVDADVLEDAPGAR